MDEKEGPLLNRDTFGPWLRKKMNFMYDNNTNITNKNNICISSAQLIKRFKQSYFKKSFFASTGYCPLIPEELYSLKEIRFYGRDESGKRVAIRVCDPAYWVVIAFSEKHCAWLSKRAQSKEYITDENRLAQIANAYIRSQCDVDIMNIRAIPLNGEEAVMYHNCEMFAPFLGYFNAPLYGIMIVYCGLKRIVNVGTRRRNELNLRDPKALAYVIPFNERKTDAEYFGPLPSSSRPSTTSTNVYESNLRQNDGGFKNYEHSAIAKNIFLHLKKRVTMVCAGSETMTNEPQLRLFEDDVDPVSRLLYDSELYLQNWWSIKVDEEKYLVPYVSRRTLAEIEYKFSYKEFRNACNLEKTVASTTVATSVPSSVMQDLNRLHKCGPSNIALFFDIECITDIAGREAWNTTMAAAQQNQRMLSTFPRPEIVTDHISQIAVAVCVLPGDGSPVRVVAQVVGSAAPSDPLSPDDIRHTDTSVLYQDDEAPAVVVYANPDELAKYFFETCIQMTDPDLLVGYNSNVFDIPFMIYKATSSRQQNTFTNWSILRRPGKSLYAVKRRIFNSKRNSKTSGMVRFTLVTNAEGRVCIDMYEVAKSDKKLHNYKLDTLAQAILKNGVTKLKDMPPSEIWRLGLSDNRAGVKRVAQYCLRDTLLPVYIENKEYYVRGELMRFSIFGLPINEGIHRGQTWMGVTAVRRTSKRQATPRTRHSKEEAMIPYFLLGRWAGEPTELYAKRDLEGAFVVKVTPGVYACDDNVVATFDFSSLYPSIMIVLNIDKTTFVPDVASLPQEATTQVLDVQTTIGEKWSFVKQGNRQGIVPQLCKLLLTLRRLTIEQRNSTPKDDPYYNVLHMRQQKLKVTANSLYGASGVRHSPLFYFPVASTITSAGRYLLKMTITVVENLGHRVCYGDTDSVFVSIDKSKYDPIRECDIIVERVNAEMMRFRQVMGVGETHGYTLSIVHENTFSNLIIFAKKKYIGRHLRGSNETYVRGMETLRRDTLAVLRIFLQDLLQIILLNYSKTNQTKFIELIFHTIDSFVRKIKDKNFDQKQFVYSRMVNNIIDLKYPQVYAAARYVETCDSLFVLGDSIEYFIRDPDCVPHEEYRRFGIDKDCLVKQWNSIWILAAHVSMLSDTCYPSMCYILHKAAMPAILRIVGTICVDVIDELAEKFQCDRKLECRLYVRTKNAVLKKLKNSTMPKD